MASNSEIVKVHGALEKIDKYKVGNLQGYSLGFKDGYTEYRIKVKTPEDMQKVTDALNARHVPFTLEQLTSPPEPKGTKGWLITSLGV